MARYLTLLALLVLAGAWHAAAQEATGDAAPPSPPAAEQQVPPPAPDPAAAPPSPALAAVTAQIDGWNRALDGIEQAIARNGVTNEQLAAFSDDAVAISRDAARIIAELSRRVLEVQRQIDQLGPAPADGATPESETVAARRAGLQAQLATADAPLREARLTIVRADQLNAAALGKRRDRFVHQLSERSVSLLDPKLWRDMASGAPRYLSSFGLVLRESATSTARRIAGSPLAFFVLLVQLGAGLAAVWYLRSFIRRHLGEVPKPAQGEAALAVPAARHLSEFLRNGILPALLLALAARLIAGSEFFAGRFDALVRELLTLLAVLFVAFSLLRVFLRPGRPHLRIVGLSGPTARSVFTAVNLGLIVAGLFHMLGVAAVLLWAPFGVSLALSALFSAVCLATAAWALVAVANDGTPDAAEAGTWLIRWRYVRAVLWLAVIVGAGALLFGFIGLAEFVAYQIVIATIVMAILWLVLRWTDEARQSLLAGHSATANARGGRSIVSGLRRGTGRQVAIVGFGLLRLAVIGLAIMALLLPWGVRTADWLVIVNRAFFGFEVGELTISVSSILLAVAIFLVGFGVTRALQQWIGGQYLPTTGLDAGLRNSITTVLGYVGIVIAVFLAIGSTGLSLSNVAIVAGALSVGIGLGLQSIVNNFVSGLILLAERPIKVGDWIVTRAGEGTVRRISVRSTEIDTFERATIVVPNSTLITEPLTNWTHRSTLGRIGVAVAVGYSVDPAEVRRILIEQAASHAGILRTPEPAVFFTDFGAGAMNFELRAWVADISDGFQVRSDLRYAILAAFRAQGIEMPAVPILPQPLGLASTPPPAPPAPAPEPPARPAGRSKPK